jgi:hypothetical protein
MTGSGECQGEEKIMIISSKYDNEDKRHWTKKMRR